MGWKHQIKHDNNTKLIVTPAIKNKYFKFVWEKFENFKIIEYQSLIISEIPSNGQKIEIV